MTTTEQNALLAKYRTAFASDCPSLKATTAVVVRKNIARLPSRLRFTNASITKAIQTLSNLQDYSNGFNDLAVQSFLDTNPQYYHGLSDALLHAKRAVESLEAEVAKRDALALAHYEKTQGI